MEYNEASQENELDLYTQTVKNVHGKKLMISYYV